MCVSGHTYAKIRRLKREFKIILCAPSSCSNMHSKHSVYITVMIPVPQREVHVYKPTSETKTPSLSEHLMVFAVLQ